MITEIKSLKPHAPPPAKPPTINQARCERAWAMVQTQPTGTRRYAFTREQIVAATGVSVRTVADMRTADSTLRARGEFRLGQWVDARRRAFQGKDAET